MNLKHAIPLVIALSLVTGTGTYTFHELVQYLKEKPPGNQTLLDRIYIQHFRFVSLRNFMIGVVGCIIILGLQPPWYITATLGWCDLFMRSLAGVSLFVCLLVKVVLVYKPAILEGVSDDTFCLWSK